MVDAHVGWKQASDLEIPKLEENGWMRESQVRRRVTLAEKLYAYASQKMALWDRRIKEDKALDKLRMPSLLLAFDDEFDSIHKVSRMLSTPSRIDIFLSTIGLLKANLAW